MHLYHELFAANYKKAGGSQSQFKADWDVQAEQAKFLHITISSPLQLNFASLKLLRQFHNISDDDEVRGMAISLYSVGCMHPHSSLLRHSPMHRIQLS